MKNKEQFTEYEKISILQRNSIIYNMLQCSFFIVISIGIIFFGPLWGLLGIVVMLYYFFQNEKSKDKIVKQLWGDKK
ncbi:MAG: hypothetical protein ACOC5T_10275 [Elusimicrobiota bacterium]